MDERKESSLFKAHRTIMSEYNIISNYTKPRGITILLKKRTGITLGNVDASDENIIILSILTASNETIDIATIYGPSDKDDPAFFERVSDKLDNREYQHKIIIGDWNDFPMFLRPQGFNERFCPCNSPRIRGQFLFLSK